MTQNIRLVGLDLDGTALNSKKELSPRTRAAIQGAIAAGIQVLPATGRIFAGIPQEFLAIPGVRYALASNGAVVYDKGKVIHSDCLSVAETLSLLCFLKDFDTLPAVYINGAAYNEPVDFGIFAEFHAPASLAYLHNTRTIVPDLAALVREKGQPVEKLNIMFTSMDERARTWKALEDDGRFTVTASLASNIEINTPTANKGAALLKLGERLGIPQSGVMAMGDGTNDVEMLRVVGHGVAMGDAVPEVMAVADEVTATADEEGVALVLERLMRETEQEGTR